MSNSKLSGKTESSRKLPLQKPHQSQKPFVFSESKRIAVNAGRQSGKTSGLAIRAVKRFIEGKSVNYYAPSADQTANFMRYVRAMLLPAIDAGKVTVVTSPHGRVATPSNIDARINARTISDPDSARGDTCDEVLVDEAAHVDPYAVTSVLPPMVATRNGSIILASTPTSILKEPKFRGDKRWFNKLFASSDKWEKHTFKSQDNPAMTQEAYDTMTSTMSELEIRIECNAEIVDESPYALWKRENIIHRKAPETLARVVVGVDPSGSSNGGTTGIVASAYADSKYYILEDHSMSGTPHEWGKAVIDAYHTHKADAIVVERNYGGEMCKANIHAIDDSVYVREVVATRGKAIRAQPIATLYETEEQVFHDHSMTELEEQMCLWQPDFTWSPDRLDALVWGMTYLSESSNTFSISVPLQKC